MSGSLPRSIVVKRLIESRYPSNKRPSDWDTRRDGRDIVETAEGEHIALMSDGSQSTPKEGWSLVLTAGDNQRGYSWTLYSLGRA